MKKKVAVALMLCVVMALVAVPCLASSTPPPVTTSDIAGVMTPVTNQFSVSNIIEFLGYIIGACIGLVFLWWAIRKAWRAIMAAATRGKARM